MSSILVLNSSANGAASVSKQLVQDTVEKLRAAHPGAAIVERDLGENPVPHLTSETTPAIRGAEATTAGQKEAVALSDTLIAELKDADTVVIGAPMYNFGIPSTLKTWFGLRAARGDHLPLFGERSGRPDEGQACHRHPEPRRLLQALAQPSRWIRRSRIWSTCSASWESPT